LDDAPGPRQEVDEVVDERRVAELHEHGRSWSPRCPDARRGSPLTVGEDRKRVYATNAQAKTRRVRYVVECISGDPEVTGTRKGG
jgi:hypothetical protein